MKIKFLIYILLLFLSISLFSQSAPKLAQSPDAQDKTAATKKTTADKEAAAKKAAADKAAATKKATADKAAAAKKAAVDKTAAAKKATADKEAAAKKAAADKTAAAKKATTDKEAAAKKEAADKEESKRADSTRKVFIADSTAKADADLKTVTESKFNLINILPWGIIVLMLSLFGFLFSRKQNEVEKLEKELDQIKHSEIYQTENFTSKFTRLEEDLRKSNTEIESLQDELKAERKKSAQLQSNQTVSEVPLEVVVPVNKNVSPIKYARYADLGDGFTASELLNEEDSETIFEITITSPNTATYRISGNPSAQKFALSNTSYFLGKTCKYDSSPTGGGIKNELNGDLKLQGNKWLIINAAKISFS